MTTHGLQVHTSTKGEYGSPGASIGEGSCLREVAGSSHWERPLPRVRRQLATSRRAKNRRVLFICLAALCVIRGEAAAALISVAVRR